MFFIFTDNLDWAAFGWFLTCWIGYTFYAKRAVKKSDVSISAVIFKYRIEWIKDMMRRDNRVPDLLLLGNLVQMVNFMATTTIFVLAGLITILYSSESVMDLLKDHSFVVATTQEQVQFKTLTLVIIFVYAFFRFTWAMRQHSFCSILIGSAPYVKQQTLNDDEMQFAMQLARISDRAGHEFNYGLRSYYFALSFLGWFISPYALFITCTAVVIVLYRREFKSKTLDFMITSRESYTRLQAAHYAAVASNLN
jgi:uncharacterized membrane protein